jgi:glutaconate CoA-transferase, subunit B
MVEVSAEQDFSYSSEEMMLCCAAREIKDRETVFVGIGTTILAALLAKKTHAPNSVLLFESGIIGASAERLALSIADPALVSGSLMLVEFFDFFTMFLQNGNVDVGFVGGAQIDQFGNVNSTMIGDYSNPKVRFPGGGGAFDMTMAKRTIVVMPHEKRRFVEHVDFITTPGRIINGKSRSQLGIPGNGPDVVITTKGVIRFSSNNETYLASYHPNSSIEEIQRETGWSLNVSRTAECTKPPTQQGMNILRAFDPKRILLGRH